MSVNYTVVNGGYASDLDDLFIRKDIFSTGGLWSWGNNGYGQLGDNTVVSKSSPVQTVVGGTSWKQVFSNDYTSAAIKTDGTLWLWGRNDYGQLGDNTRVSKSSPVQTIAGGTNWKQVSVGSQQLVAAIKTDGTLWTWGRNSQGELGDNTTVPKSSPVQTISGGSNWKQVACGYHVAAIKTDGTLWLWGANGFSLLGDNTTIPKSSPVQTVAGGTNWRQVACGENNTAAIKTDGTLWLWGSNVSGQLGDNSVISKSSPVQTIAGGTNWKQVACAGFTIAAIKTDGTLWNWGSNVSGQLGDNTRTNRSSPVQTVASGNNWKQCDVQAAIKTDGTLWTWGQNTDGQLGDGSVTWTSSPIQTVAGGTNWKQVSRGDGGNMIAIREDFY